MGLLADGVEAAIRLSREGAVLVAQAAGSLQEAADRSRLFWASTASSGVAPGTALGTTAAFCLANPNNSRVRLVIRKVSIGYISGTLGAGTVFAAMGAPSQTAISGTPITVVQGGGGGGGGARAAAYTTATIPAAPLAAFPLWTLGAGLATTAGFPSESIIEIDGGLVVEPGGSFVMHAVAAAGTSPLVVFGCAWEEVPV